jgi:hypothetical protein
VIDESDIRHEKRLDPTISIFLPISIELGNETFVIENDLPIGVVNHKWIHDLSNLSNISIPRYSEIFGSNCFSYCKSLSSITVESNSRLTRTESHEFL